MASRSGATTTSRTEGLQSCTTSGPMEAATLQSCASAAPDNTVNNSTATVAAAHSDTLPTTETDVEKDRLLQGKRGALKKQKKQEAGKQSSKKPTVNEKAERGSPPKSAGFTDYESDSDIDDPDAAAEQASMDLWMQRVNALYTHEQLIELTNGL